MHLPNSDKLVNLENPEFASDFFGICTFMFSNFVAKNYRGSWRYQVFEANPMGITEKNYELSFATKRCDR